MAKFNGIAKITLNGETFSFDFGKAPMSEALALEQELGMKYAQYEQDLEAGSLQAMCGLVWLIWRRNGRTVELADILAGKIDFDMLELADSLDEFAKEAKAAAEAAEADPTPRPAPGGTRGTGTATSRSSRSTTTSGRGKSRS
jgi:hypothetical protein